MTHDEYEQKRIALLTHYLHLAFFDGSADADTTELDSFAKNLATKLDRLALEIDPFAGKIKTPTDADVFREALQDIAEHECAYRDGCPENAGTRHGECTPCTAKKALTSRGVPLRYEED
jgi:hypothetical protein